MNGSWMSEASGSQWALLGIGQVRIGGQDAAGLDEGPDEVDVESLARVERARDVDVVVRIGVRGVRIEGDEDGPDDEREREKAAGGSAQPVQRSTGSWAFRPVRIGHVRRAEARTEVPRGRVRSAPTEASTAQVGPLDGLPDRLSAGSRLRPDRARFRLRGQ